MYLGHILILWAELKKKPTFSIKLIITDDNYIQS